MSSRQAMFPMSQLNIILDPAGDVVLSLFDEITGPEPMNHQLQHHFLQFSWREEESETERRMLGALEEDSDAYYSRITFQVRSTHLSRESIYFRQILEKNQHQIRVSDPSLGPPHVALRRADHHPQALLILLSIFHYYFRRVPSQVSMNLLVEIAISVNLHQCHAKLKDFSGLWIDNLRNRIPTAMTTDMIHWLCISVVFELSDDFERMTRIIIQEVRSSVQFIVPSRMPIPPSVLDAIDFRRHEAIEGIGCVIDDVAQDFESPQGYCAGRSYHHTGFECDALVSGTLRKNLRMLGIPETGRTAYQGTSFVELAARAKGMICLSLCEVQRRNTPDHQHVFFNCGNMKQLIAKRVTDLETRVASSSRLQLQSYLFPNLSRPWPEILIDPSLR